VRIAYVTALFPHEQGEGFLIEEVRALSAHFDIFIFPVRLETKLPYHPVEAATVFGCPLISWKILVVSLLEFFRRPFLTVSILAKLVAADLRLRIILKNLAVAPKALWLASRVRYLHIEHIHAHWAGTSATMAWMAASIVNVPWSFTAHRWDIDEANALSSKLRSASFARAISRRGLEQLRKAQPNARLMHIPMGVAIPATFWEPTSSRELRLFVPANMFTVKGHKYLLFALARLEKGSVVMSCDFAGSGPEQDRLVQLVTDLHLESVVRFLGTIPQDEVIDRYRLRTVDAVVLPSIITQLGEQEGVPVALMEAMAYAVPVIATRTGAIPELVEDAGLLVPPQDSEALRDAIVRMAEPEVRRQLGCAGRQRVCDRYDILITAKSLADAIAEGQAQSAL